MHFTTKVNTKEPGHDINVTAVWKLNITGRGVVIAVVDDGQLWWVCLLICSRWQAVVWHEWLSIAQCIRIH